MNKQIIFKLLAFFVLLAAIGGVGFFAYQAGVAQGSPITIKAPSGETLQQPYPYYGHGMPYYPHPMGLGFGCFGVIIPLFLFVVAMKALRFMFWGSRFGHHHMMGGHGHWRGHCGGHGNEEGDIPPMFAEWHKRAHGETFAEKPEEKKE
jgi:hypothetical protein